MTLSTSALPFAARTCHAWLVRLTRARGRCFLRGRKALLNDFCRAFGHSKARETQRIFSLFLKDTSSVSLWLTPSPTGEGWRKSLLSSAHKLNSRPPNSVSATPTHMLRICVNPSFKLFLVASRRPVRTKCPDRPTIA